MFDDNVDRRRTSKSPFIRTRIFHGFLISVLARVRAGERLRHPPASYGRMSTDK